MEFLDRLRPEDRERLLAASAAVHLETGEFLLRRGEAGGDIFLLETGSLEVVDTRQRPEVVLDVLGPGKVLGALSFIDGLPRAADIRVASAAAFRRWVHADLKRLLQTDVALSARFYSALSASVVQQARATARRGSPGVRSLVQDGGPVPVAVAQRAREVAQPSLKSWTDAEVRLRASATDTAAVQMCEAALDTLVQAAQVWVGAMGEHARARAAGDALRKEVQPYIGRARLIFLAQEAGLGANGAEFMAHLLLGEPSGDGPLGTAVDKALLGLPTAAGVRARQRLAVACALKDQPEDRPLAITVVQPNCGALLAKLVARMSGQGGEVTVIDGDRETLAIVDLGMHKRPDGVTLKLVQEELDRLASGVSELHHEPQDAIVIDGLFDHLPDRMVAALCAWCVGRLKPKGRLIASAMGPSTDQQIFDHLVGWPMMRRTPGELLELIRSAGFSANCEADGSAADHPGLVVWAQT